MARNEIAHDGILGLEVAMGFRASGNWKLETGNWKLETGNWKLETGNWNFPLSVCLP
jgi:hypothetical protein